MMIRIKNFKANQIRKIKVSIIVSKDPVPACGLWFVIFTFTGTR